MTNSLMMQFDQADLTWVKRDKNAWADWVCNCSMNEAEDLPLPEKPNAKQKGNKLPLITRMMLHPGKFKFQDWSALKVKNSREAWFKRG